MGHPTDTQLMNAIKEGTKEIIESIKKYHAEQDFKLNQIEKKLKIMNSMRKHNGNG